MNSLSWFLYAAGLVEKLSTITAMVAVTSIMFCFAVLMGQLFTEGELSSNCPNLWKYWWRSVAGAIVAGVVWSAVPSTQTLYAIAASEYGEQLAQNDTVKGMASDATKALQQWIKKQIEPAAESK